MVIADIILYLGLSDHGTAQSLTLPTMNQRSAFTTWYEYRCDYNQDNMRNIEGQYAIKHQQCIALSEQQGLDCLDCGTCDGGFMDIVMQQFARRAGVMREEDYPYVALKGTCYKDTKKVVVKVLRAQQLDIPDEDTLMNKLVEIWPLSVSIKAGVVFNSYVSGVMHPDDFNCGPDVNHGMLLVGYGEEKDGTKYWIIKNSWGQKWGEQGYLRLLRGVNACAMGTSFTATATVA